jgi:galactosamine-6-phosphate isomerase
MKILISDSYESMSKNASDDVIQKLQSTEQPLFCVASGESPNGLYKELVDRHHQKLLDVSGWYFLGLDEWVDLDKNDQGSCRYVLDRHLFDPLKVKEERICFFNGKFCDPVSECERVEEFIRLNGPIDLAVLGLGMNGHVGLNEPGVSPFLRCHVSKIDEMTRMVGQKYFTHPQLLSKGITLGIATLMEAKHLILLISGVKKAAITQRVLKQEISNDLPASLLRNHPDFTVYLDKGAASHLDPG